MDNPYQLLPDLTPEEYEVLRESIRADGVKVPIEYDEDGIVLDGHHRLRACQELGITDWPRVVRLGMSESAKRNHVRALNLFRRHLSDEQRREQWVAMRRDGMTYQAIADTSGVSKPTIIRALDESTNVLSQPTVVISSDGKQRPAQYKPRTESVYQPMAATVFSSRSDEYHTPLEILEASREVLVGFDLDPASCQQAQENVRAGAFYTKEQDGLSLPWFGRVWLNPPYGKTAARSNQDIWSERLINEYRAGHVTEGILLVKAALGYIWFEDLFRDWPVCFARSRLSFIVDGESDDGQSKQGTALFYIGLHFGKFAEVFRRIGRIIPPEEVINAALFR